MKTLKNQLFNVFVKLFKLTHTAAVCAEIAQRQCETGVIISLSADSGTFANWRINLEKDDVRVCMMAGSINIYNYK